MIVLDASVTIAWCMPAERGEYARHVAAVAGTTTCVVPALWALEVGNSLAHAERRGQLATDELRAILADLARLSLHVEATPREAPFTTILDLARSHRLTTYDAAYLEVALRLRLPLATLDDDLRKAAKKAGAKLFAA